MRLKSKLSINKKWGRVAAFAMTFAALIIALTTPDAAMAAGTHLDTTFFASGKTNFGFGNGTTSEANAVAVQADGKVVVAGRTYINGNWDIAIARLWSNGVLDSTFDHDGLLTIDFAGGVDTAYAVAIQPDGKIVVAGETIPTTGSANYAVVRVTNLGVPDPTFGTDGKATVDFQGQNDQARAVALQPDGKIIIVGYAVSGAGDWGVLRLTDTGLPDPTFGNNGRVSTDFSNGTDVATGVVVLPDNKIIVAGTAGTAEGSDFGLVRYTSLGVLDSSFQNGGKMLIDIDAQSYDDVKALAKTADGKLVIGGESRHYSTYPQLTVVRCSTDGVLDNTFDDDGKASVTFNSTGNNYMGGLAVNGAGEIAVAARIDGRSVTAGFGVVRFLNNGKVDSRFGSGGRVNTIFGLGEKVANAVTFQPDGKIVVVGTVRGFSDFGVARYNSRGIATANDFDGDGVADLGVYRPSEGMWYLKNSATGANSYVRFGLSTDQPVAGDYDGDGKTDIAVYRPSTGSWYIQQSSDGQLKVTAFGLSNDWPVPGDYDGDGKTDVAVYRLATGTWYLLGSTTGLQIHKYGSDVAFPMQGDYDGDGATDIAVFRPADKTWWIHGSYLGDRTVQFGSNGDTPVPADYDGDGVTDVAMFRTDGNWWVQRSQTATVSADHWGAGTDLTATGDFDGDGKVDLSVFRPSNGGWYMTRGDGTWRLVVWGVFGDQLLVGVTLRSAS